MFEYALSAFTRIVTQPRKYCYHRADNETEFALLSLYLNEKRIEFRPLKNGRTPLVHRPRIFVFLLACAAVVSFVCLRQTKSQSGLRRITNTTEEGININPSLSGDGRILRNKVERAALESADNCPVYCKKRLVTSPRDLR